MSLGAVVGGVYFGIAAGTEYVKGRKNLAYMCAVVAIGIIAQQIFINWYQQDTNFMNLYE